MRGSGRRGGCWRRGRWSVANPYGFTNSYHPAFNRGWRLWLFVAGVFEWRWARRLTKIRWELWWVDPCCSLIWHPVSEPSTVDPPVRPCPWRYLQDVEDWTCATS